MSPQTASVAFKSSLKDFSSPISQNSAPISNPVSNSYTEELILAILFNFKQAVKWILPFELFLETNLADFY